MGKCHRLLWYWGGDKALMQQQLNYSLLMKQLMLHDGAAIWGRVWFLQFTIVRKRAGPHGQAMLFSLHIRAVFIPI